MPAKANRRVVERIIPGGERKAYLQQRESVEMGSNRGVKPCDSFH
jgi:hypothetical protein